jgi:hypothetical protein
MLGREVAVTSLAVGAVAWLISANAVRFQRRVDREAQQMWAVSRSPAPLDRARLAELPAPARAYLDRALRRRRSPVRTARLLHGGSFRPTLEGPSLPIAGRQFLSADPPGFVWWGRAHVAPGLWIDARDRCVAGRGGMRVSLESTLELADARGQEIDQGSLLRLLAEMAWMPTALVDPGYVSWSAAEGVPPRARATLRVHEREVSAVFEFREDGLPAAVFAERHRDLGGGRSALTPWSGRLDDFREVDGLLVPHLLTACWHVGGREVPYARFVLERLEYDESVPFP